MMPNEIRITQRRHPYLYHPTCVDLWIGDSMKPYMTLDVWVYYDIWHVTYNPWQSRRPRPFKGLPKYTQKDRASAMRAARRALRKFGAAEFVKASQC